MSFGTKREDYWPDYYAFLDINPKASIQQIKNAIKDFRAATHPDQNRRANEDMLLVMNRLRHHIDDAEDALLSEAREAFDVFRDKYPERLAKINRGDGVTTIPSAATIPLNQETMNLDGLLNGNLTPIDTEIAKKALRLTGQNAGNASLKSMRKAYTALPNDPNIQEGYKKALEDELMLISVTLGGAWQSAGAGTIATHFTTSAGDPYRPRISVQEKITEVSQEILPDAVKTRAAALIEGKTTKPLLLTSEKSENTTAITNPDDKQISDITKHAQKAFLERTKTIKSIALKRASLIKELLHLTETVKYSSSENHKDVLIHILSPGKIIVISFLVRLENGYIASHKTLDAYKYTHSKDISKTDNKNNSYGIVYVPEVGEDIGAHLYHILHKYGHLEAETDETSQTNSDYLTKTTQA